MKKILYFQNKNIVSEAIKENRLKKNMSQSQLAAKMQTLGVNIDQQMISRIESNQRFVTDYELACFCKIFGISADEILSLPLNKN